jgi:Leucine-rich repeat (LRR) protein
MPDVAAKLMPNATAFVLSAIEESFTAVGALSTAFDAGLAALRDATLSNRAYTHGASSSSPARIAPLGMASVSLHQALLDAHSALSSQCTVSVAECSIPDNSEPGRNLREQIARVATWMHTTLDAVAATLDPSIATGTPVRTHSSSASLGFAGRPLGDQMGSAQSLTGTRIIMDDGGLCRLTRSSPLVLQPARSQLSADTNEQLHSTRPFIPADLVQNTAEYLGRVASFLSFRGVSTEWQGAVSDAVGFLNGRCWNRLELERKQHFSLTDSNGLWARLRLDDPRVVARCAMLCLRQRLVTVTCGWSSSIWFTLRLLGETNETLVTLNLHDSLRPLDDLSCLLGCVALRELSLQDTQVTNETFVRLDRLLARLHKLDLSGCGQLKAISNLAPATSLRELNLAHSRVKDLRGLEKLVALETLDVTDIRTTGLSILRQCPRLVTLTAHGDITALESIIHAAPPSLIDCRLHIDRQVSALDSRSLSCLRRSTVLKFSDLGTASLEGLEEIPSLQQLDLERPRVDEVRSLAGCRALRKLRLMGARVNDVGIVGLERIATLETLRLEHCRHITSVASLRHCTALRELIMDGTCVTDAGIAGLECIGTLTKLTLAYCKSVTSVSSLRHSPSLRELNISDTAVTAAGSMGLDEIGTLQCLKAGGCAQLDASTLRRCRSLREVDLSESNVPDAVLAALADVSTLETLSLAHCREVHVVSALARSVSLCKLHLEGSDVCDAGIEGLERIPSLTWLSLNVCEFITNVTNLFRSKSLRILVLLESSVTDAGLAGLEMAPALELVDLRNCAGVADIAAVALRAAERLVKVI